MPHDPIRGESPDLFNELMQEWTLREDQEMIATMDRMGDLYQNKLPPEFDQYFPKGAPKHVVGMAKLAWNDLATTIGRIPDLRMDALDETTTEEKRVSLLERVAHGYLRRAEPHGKTFMWLVAWWLVGMGRAVTVVTPGTDLEGQPTPHLLGQGCTSLCSQHADGQQHPRRDLRPPLQVRHRP